MESSWMLLIAAALGGSLLSLVGGLFLLSRKLQAVRIQRVAIPFAAGALLAAAFFDLIPEAFAHSNDSRLVAGIMLSGFLVFFVLERFLGWFHHHHEPDAAAENIPKRHKSAAALIVTGDVLHNLIDGAVIGAAFLVDPVVGLVTTIAVAAHEIPQEIGDFAALLALGMKRRKVLFVNIGSALATVVAASLVFAVGESLIVVEPVLLAITAGLFIYIAASDLIPTIHDEPRLKVANLQALILLIGIAVIGLTTSLAHNYLPEEHSHIDDTSHHEVHNE